MDYKKLYNEALERARKLGTREMPIDPTRSIQEQIFPEFRESEDEKVRKEIISFVLNIISKQKDSFEDDKFDRWLSWLEKQGGEKDTVTPQWMIDFLKEHRRHFATPMDYDEKQETDGRLLTIIKWLEGNPQLEQKSTDKVEPKFKVGDWITFYGSKPFKILKVEAEQNGILDYLLLEQNGHDSYYNKKYVDENARLWTIQDAKDGDVLAAHECYVIFKEIDGLNIKCYCAYHYMGFNPSFYVDTLQNKNAFYPATKEQRDTLFSKMKEAGYGWDSEQKELRKIDNEEVNGEDYGIDGLWHAQRILEKTLGKVDGYQTDDGILDHKTAITAVKKLHEQKPAWSEEDEEMLNEIIEDVRPIGECPDYPTEEEREYYYKGQDKVNWLKSLKSNWKPSEEQTQALKYIIDFHSIQKITGILTREQLATIKSLYDDLKKL